MSFRSPQSKCSTIVESLGKLQGFEFENGVQQYCGIPYASLSKRWTRSTLQTIWQDNFHDGTKLGNSCPHPLLDGDDADDLVPVPPAPHFAEAPKVDELSALVMNIVVPFAHKSDTASLPVLAYVHGGSLLYGGANLPIFDAVNLVSHSLTINRPIICVNFNYRVGLGGFLASFNINAELAQDGHKGCGNFGLTDQQVAFQWIQKYISQFGGDPSNLTAVGESAGGISISNQLAAAHPPVFRRAVCMSGLSAAIPAWTLAKHEELFTATCQHFGLSPASSKILDQLRQIPQQELANATPAIQGVPSGTGNPCLDGYFHLTDPQEIHSPPEWLESYMIGDVYHEGVIFHINIMSETFSSIRETLDAYIGNKEEIDAILGAYEISQDLPHDTLITRVEHMCGDAIFKIPNYRLAQKCKALQDKNSFFTYHFDQRSRIKNIFEGTAYHAHELLYLFGNLWNEFSDEEIAMSKDFMTAWIKFVYGEVPWSTGESLWKVWGPDCKQAVMSTVEDEEIRSYKRMDMMLSLGGGETWKKWLRGVDALVNRRKSTDLM